jgi:predicted metal-dependent phosphoesterase TrpH
LKETVNMDNQFLLDLHTHSTASDGKLSPAALVRAAAAKGISTLAITDHDTISGLAEAELEAQKLRLRLIHGVEIEINWQEFPPISTNFQAGAEDSGGMRREFHLLGLGIDRPTTEFLKLMEELRESRENRNLMIVKKMRELGLPCDLDEIYALSGTSFIGRPHFAEYLVQKKVVRNVESAFKKFLAKGECLFIPRRGADFERSLRLIKDSGGISVLAHPTTLYVSWGHMPGILQKLREAGLDGLEAWHPITTVHESRRLLSLAQPLGLCITAGSDFHGEGRRDRTLGLSSGNTKITSSLCDFSPLAGALDTFDGSLRELIAALVERVAVVPPHPVPTEGK